MSGKASRQSSDDTDSRADSSWTSLQLNANTAREEGYPTCSTPPTGFRKHTHPKDSRGPPPLPILDSGNTSLSSSGGAHESYGSREARSPPSMSWVQPKSASTTSSQPTANASSVLSKGTHSKNSPPTIPRAKHRSVTKSTRDAKELKVTASIHPASPSSDELADLMQATHLSEKQSRASISPEASDQSASKFRTLRGPEGKPIFVWGEGPLQRVQGMPSWMHPDDLDQLSEMELSSDF